MNLVDTSVLVDIDRGGVDDRIERLDDEGRHAISVVTLTELRVGVNNRYGLDEASRSEPLSALERLLARFDLLPISRATAGVAADVFVELRTAGEPLDDLHDIYIAATARTEQLPVLTANVSHFDRIDDVRVIDWNDY